MLLVYNPAVPVRPAVRRGSLYRIPAWPAPDARGGEDSVECRRPGRPFPRRVRGGWDADGASTPLLTPVMTTVSEDRASVTVRPVAKLAEIGTAPGTRGSRRGRVAPSPPRPRQTCEVFLRRSHLDRVCMHSAARRWCRPARPRRNPQRLAAPSSAGSAPVGGHYSAVHEPDAQGHGAPRAMGLRSGLRAATPGRETATAAAQPPPRSLAVSPTRKSCD